MQVSFEVLDCDVLKDTIETLGRKGYMFYNNYAFVGPRVENYKEALDPVFLRKGMYIVINDNKTFLFRYYLEHGLYAPLRLFKNIQTQDNIIIVNEGGN